MAIDQKDLECIQRIRDQWTELPLNDPLVVQLQPFANGDNLYQLWLEVQVMYLGRWRAELEYQKSALAKQVESLRDNNTSLAEQILREREERSMPV